jgi:cytochrome c5
MLRILAAVIATASSCALGGQSELPVSQSASVPVDALRNGKDVYDAVCSGCHGTGSAGAPRTGDRQAWASRLAEGMGLLYLHTLKGYTGKAGVMPARGGRADLPTELVKQSVDYIVSQSN